MSQGETLIGITFMHDIVTWAVQGRPVKVVAPCEGTGYEIGSMSIIKGAPNLANAKKWYDWALSPEAQALGEQAKAYQVPSNKAAPTPPQAPKFTQIKLINYDYKYGSSAERKRLPGARRSRRSRSEESGGRPPACGDRGRDMLLSTDPAA
jgi:iron(III) transport system substrate-binding protein